MATEKEKLEIKKKPQQVSLEDLDKVGGGGDPNVRNKGIEKLVTSMCN